MALSRQPVWCALAVCLAMLLGIGSACASRPLLSRTAIPHLFSIQLQRLSAEFRCPGAAIEKCFDHAVTPGHYPGFQVNRGAS